MSEFSGVYPALVTPFDGRGRPDAGVVRELVDWQLQAGVDGFYVCGSTGEGLLMSPDERRTMLEATVRAAQGRGRVIAHVAALDTATTVALARHAADQGADAISVLPPLVFVPDAAGLREHYRMICEATPLPVFLYYMPWLTGGRGMSVEEFKNLLDFPTIRGIKFSDYDHFTMRQMGGLRPDVVVFSGYDEVFLSGLVSGAHGGIGATYNLMPHLFVGIQRAFRNGDYVVARALQDRVCAMIQTMCGMFLFGTIKAGLTHLGFAAGNPRRPMRPLNPDERKVLFARMDELGIGREL